MNCYLHAFSAPSTLDVAYKVFLEYPRRKCRAPCTRVPPLSEMRRIIHTIESSPFARFGFSVSGPSLSSSW